MAARKSVGDQFHAAEQTLLAAQRQYDRLRAEYFADRCRRIKAGEQVEPLIVANSDAWREQLGHEAVYRKNAETDRIAGLVT